MWHRANTVRCAMMRRRPSSSSSHHHRYCCCCYGSPLLLLLAALLQSDRAAAQEGCGDLGSAVQAIIAPCCTVRHTRQSAAEARCHPALHASLQTIRCSNHCHQGGPIQITADALPPSHTNHCRGPPYKLMLAGGTLSTRHASPSQSSVWGATAWETGCCTELCMVS